MTSSAPAPAPDLSPPSGTSPSACRHCGQPCADGHDFCCNGCAGAWEIIQGMGLDSYYRQRTLDETARPLIPVENERGDFTHYVRTGPEGTTAEIHLMVEGMHCAACVWLIERVLERQNGVRAARISMTTRRLVLKWDPAATDVERLVAAVMKLGYRLVPYDPDTLGSADRKEEKSLLICLAVAGFAASNVMLFSVSLWAGADLDPLTRMLMQWYSALIVLPASAFAIRPFARPAWDGLKNRRVTMDFPITLAVVLTLGMSLYESLAQRGETYFEAAASLLFFLLIGRYLDRRVRSRALSCAEDLTLLQTHAATILGPDGTARSVPASALKPGDILLTRRGEKISADGIVTEGFSALDCAIVTGESLPVSVRPGDPVPSGAVNLDTPLRIQVTAAGTESTLGRMAALAESAALTRNRYTRLADRAARYYAPAVHTLALTTLAFWWVWSHDFHLALTHAVAVLIVTCPCALALAVPAVQVAAASTLLRAGILLKRPEALEKLETVDTVVFDKTGTLTTGHFHLLEENAPPAEILRAAASLAAASTHPLSRALLRAAGPTAPARNVREVPGQGLESEDGARLGTAEFCGVQEEENEAVTRVYYRPAPPTRKASPSFPPPSMRGEGYAGQDSHGEAARSRVGGGENTVSRFTFSDTLRPSAAETVSAFRRAGLEIALLSGDREGPVRAMAEQAGIPLWRARMRPEDKHAFLAEKEKAGHRVLMIGDGINDAPALAAACVSMSPGSAATLSRNAADIILQGEKLYGAFATFALARRAMRTARQNFALSIGYNIIAVPMAMAGLITPLWAALFMSASSITVMLNALRLSGKKAWMSSSS